MADTAAIPAGRTVKRRSRGLPERRLALFMVAPSMILIAVVALWPIIYAIWLSMHEYSLRQAGLSRWAEPAGLGNYIDALKSSEFWTATRITFICGSCCAAGIRELTDRFITSSERSRSPRSYLCVPSRPRKKLVCD